MEGQDFFSSFNVLRPLVLYEEFKGTILKHLKYICFSKVKLNFIFIKA